MTEGFSSLWILLFSTLCLVSFSICVLIIFLAELFQPIRGRAVDILAVQCTHKRNTARIGGVAFFCAIALSSIFAPVQISNHYNNFVMATSILFFVGLLEDIGIHVSPRMRMLAAVIASIFVIGLIDVWIPRVGIPELDFLAQYWFLGIPLTVLLTSGIANGFNLIDGVNGLASLTGITAAVAIALISAQADYMIMVQLCVMLVAAISGFFLLNFPFGLIFLGDAGAYTLGFILSWFGISVLINAPDVSAWAVLLTMFWPVADTLLAIFRRSRRGVSTTAPDRLHVHQMVMRAIEICWLSRARRSISNPLTTLVLFPFFSAPPLVGVLLWDQNGPSFLAVCMFGCLFSLSYIAAPKLISHFRRRKSHRSLILGLPASMSSFRKDAPGRSGGR